MEDHIPILEKAFTFNFGQLKAFSGKRLLPHFLYISLSKYFSFCIVEYETGHCRNHLLKVSSVAEKEDFELVSDHVRWGHSSFKRGLTKFLRFASVLKLQVWTIYNRSCSVLLLKCIGKENVINRCDI